MNKRNLLVTVLLVMILTVSVGGTVAFLMDKTAQTTNTFLPEQVTCKIDETFDGTTKSNITVTNTSKIPVYIRVALIPFWKDADGNVAGAESWTPDFTPQGDWYKGSDGYYYYPTAVQPDGTTPSLTSGIVMPTAADGKTAALTIAAEAIQSEGNAVTVDANGWAITPVSVNN